jgi:Tfp pilus assembly protein PilF
MTPATAEFSTAFEYLQKGQVAECETLCRKIVAADANNAGAWHLLGVIALQSGMHSNALDYLGHAVRVSPEIPEAHNTQGLAFAAQERFEDSAASFRRAVTLKPEFAEAHNNLGNVLQKLDRMDEAISSFKHALAIRPEYATAQLNLGNALKLAGRLGDAANSFRRAIELKPDLAEAHNNLALALVDERKFEEADECYRRAIEAQPDYLPARWNQALLKLLRGDFEHGWLDYELRWQTGQTPSRWFPESRWEGQTLPSGTILIHCEQGFGDTFQFSRYIPLVKQRVGRVVVICQRSAMPLLQSCVGVDQLLGDGDPLPTFDVHSPLLSLPEIFQTRLDTIPAEVPYLFANSQLIADWRERMKNLDGFRIGINWRGRAGKGTFRRRDIPLNNLLDLASTIGTHWVPLTKEVVPEDMAQLSTQSNVFFPGSEIDTSNGPFMDTAAIMKNLDLVITSDTAVAHLAGALGVPVWVALPFVPDWRWLLDRSDSPWYPTMRLFRQKSPGDWEGVFAEMTAALRERLQLV